MLRRYVSLIAIAVVGFAATDAGSCPFCSAVTQTLRQEMSSMDAVVIAEATETIEPSDTGEIELTVRVVIAGKELVEPGQVIKSVYFGSAKKGRRFMLTGVDPPELMWSAPRGVTKRSEAYLSKVLQLPDDGLLRLEFFQEYLQDEDNVLARDAYDEFAVAPYADVKALGPKMHRDRLIGWIKDADVATDRKRLYLTMLGVCGDQKDLPLLESMLRSTKKSTKSGLDALIACFLTLKGADGLPMIDELFLANKKAEYADTYAAIMAIRFHGTETDVIAREKLVSSLHHVLERPQLADLVIPDLARWEDWTQIDKMVGLFKDASAENNWVRVPVINYLRACPSADADKALKTLEKIDPAAVKRANTFFPIPVKKKKEETVEETSSVQSDSDVQLAVVAQPSERLAKADTQSKQTAKPVASSKNQEASKRETSTKRDVSLASGEPAPLAPAVAITPNLASVTDVNPLRVLAVSALSGTSLLILMWLVLTSGSVPARN